ncbi:hypothetical protein BDF22DRAFT_741463 [Syncephalis plumigaleata]|nr:hypothetical protein BDF22DRAFT_741463 [Syncephalis plumigaleata]
MVVARPEPGIIQSVEHHFMPGIYPDTTSMESVLAGNQPQSYANQDIARITESVVSYRKPHEWDSIPFQFLHPWESDSENNWATNYAKISVDLGYGAHNIVSKMVHVMCTISLQAFGAFVKKMKRAKTMTDRVEQKRYIQSIILPHSAATIDGQTFYFMPHKQLACLAHEIIWK